MNTLLEIWSVFFSYFERQSGHFVNDLFVFDQATVWVIMKI